MSVISNIHTAIVYEAKGANKTVAQNGQRLVVTIAKADKDGNYGPHLQQTMATSVPILGRADIDWGLSSVRDAATEYFQTIQNKIVADRIKSGQREVSTDQIGMAAIIDYINTDATGDKWDAARIASWFDDTLAEPIGIALIAKGFDDAKWQASLNAYKKLIADTFSSRGTIARAKAVAIDKAFKLIESPDATLVRFQGRIDKVLNEVSLDDALGL